ncbi:MAG: hypothetical protein ACRDJF_00005 [Actinomycetota bacterium]
MSVDPSGLLALQRLIGNRAVTALIQSGDIGHLGVQRAVPAPPGPAGSDVSSGQGVELALPPEVRDPEGSFEQRPVTSIEVTAQAQVTKLDNALQQAEEELSNTAIANKVFLRASFTTQEQAISRSFSSFEQGVIKHAATEQASARAATSRTATTIRGQAREAIAAGQREVTGLETASTAVGDQQARRATTEASARVDKARPGVGGGSEEEIRQGKDKIAKSVSGKARTELARAADQTTTQVRSGVGQLRSGLYGPAREGVATKVGAAADQADRVLKQGLGTATRAIGDLTYKAKKSAGKARQTVVKGLRAARQEAIKNLDQWATSGRQRLHAVASQYRQAITASARHFSMGAASSLAPAAEVAGVQQEVDDALQGGTEGAVTGLLETTGGLREGMAQLAAQHAGAVSSAREAAQQGVSQVKTVTQAAQRRTGAGFLSTLQTTASQATAELTGAPSRVAGGLAPQHQTGVGGLAKTVDQAGTQQDRWTADARTRGERGASRLDSEASRLAGQARPLCANMI